MAMEEGSELENVRDMWEHEAHHFTPWLARNLGLLGKELGLKLEPVQQEYAVGPFSLDILARESGSGALVAIENQLEWTDIDHLGRLLIYASGTGARIAVLVAPEFVYEHAQVLDQLNRWAGPNARFYGVKVEVLRRTDGAPLEPRLRKVVWPGGWNKEITLPSGEMSPERWKYHDFFQPLIAQLIQEGFADKSVNYFGHTGRFFPSRLNQDIGYAVSFWYDGAWVSLHVRTWDSIERNNLIFDELQTARLEIEESLDAEWVWHRFEPNSFFTINIRRDGSIDDPPEKQEETRVWMLDLLPKLKEVFDPRLAEILKRSASEG